MTVRGRKHLSKTLEKLSNAHGISGYEDDVRALIQADLEELTDDIQTDSMGNLIAVKNGGKHSVMLAAHMDEIGLMVQSIDAEGFLHFVTLGGWNENILLNNRVIIHSEKGPLPGVIGSKPPHLLKPEEKDKPVKLDSMFIDVGAQNAKKAQEKGIVIGTPITLHRNLTLLMGDKVTGKALDDRAGITMLLEAIGRTRTKNTVYFVGTVQEEVGLKGAKTAAFRLEPDVAMVGEVTASSDHPGGAKTDSTVALGEGPAITVADASGRGIITPRSILTWLKGTATKHKIPYQLEVVKGGTTDAAVIHLTKAGIPTGVVSVPTRYIHSGVEVLSLHDLDNGAELIARSLDTVDTLLSSDDGTTYHKKKKGRP